MAENITEPVTYRRPIAALYNGKPVQLLAHGNMEGKSPVFQYCDEDTGQVAWESQDQFRVIDQNILGTQSIRNILSNPSAQTQFRK